MSRNQENVLFICIIASLQITWTSRGPDRIHGPQYFKAGITADLFDGLETGSQGWLILQEAIRHRVEASARPQHLCGLAHKAFSDLGSLYACQVKGRVGHNQVKTLCLDSLHAIARHYLHIGQAALLRPMPRHVHSGEAGIAHGHLAFSRQTCNVYTYEACST